MLYVLARFVALTTLSKSLAVLSRKEMPGRG
jgi:hypothetical protein